MADVRKFAVGDMVEVPVQLCSCCAPDGGKELARVTRFAEDDPDYAAHGLWLGDPPYYMVEVIGRVRLPSESVMAESWMRLVYGPKLPPGAVRMQPRRKSRAARRCM